MRIAAALVLLLAGCGRAPDPPSFSPAVPNPNPAREKDENEIRIVAFGQMLNRATPGEVCFIAFEDLGVSGWIYPSDQFMSRLVFPHLILRKVNEALHPAPDERDPADRSRYQGIRDPRTGRRSYVYSVRLEWMGADRVKARADMTGGPLSGGGSDLIIVREKGAWVFKEIAGSWAY